MALSSQFPLKTLVVQLRLAALAMMAPAVVFYAGTTNANDLSKATEKELKEARALDWVPLDELTEEQKKTVPNVCCGAYIAPKRTDADANLDPNLAPFRVLAEETESSQQTRIEFKGEVGITQGNRSVTTENAVYDKTTQQAELKGGIQMRDPNVMVAADHGQMNVETGEVQMDNARFVLYQSRIHGTAKTLHRFGDNVVNLDESEISSCEPGDDSWSIRGTKISLHPDENYGTARNMRINIKDIPIVYMPYVRFPVGNERLTGFMFPTVTHNSRNGWDTAVPFYWNIAPDFDATLTARYMSERGPMLETEVRHMATHFDTELHASVINGDHGGYSSFLEQEIAAGRLTEEQAYPYRGHDRWYAKLEQVGGRGEAWSSIIDYADMSDRDFLRDMYAGSVDSNRQAFIRQLASADYRTDHWFMGVKSDEYRVLTKDQLPIREFPRVHMDGSYQLNDWVINLNNEYVNFIENRYFRSGFDTEQAYQARLADTIYAQRVNTNYGVTLDKTYPWGFIRPGVSLRGLGYNLDDSSLVATANSTPRFLVPQAKLDTGLYFERDAGGGYLQTLEPRLFYFYSAYKNQDELYGLTPNNSFVRFDTVEPTFTYDQLFRSSRFAGGDRIDDANQVSLAISSAFISQKTGVERIRFSIGQIFYGEDRRIAIEDNRIAAREEDTRSTSDIAARVSGQVGQKLHMAADIAYDERNGRVDSSSAGLHYMDEKYRIVNISYRYTLKPQANNPSQPGVIYDQSLDQLDTSFIWPINSKWSVIARNNHDFTNNVELDTFAGLEYNDCCYRVRVVGRRWLRIDYTNPKFLSNVTNDDYEPGIMFELELKGLGSMDQRISNLLEKAVPGFKERNKNVR